MIPVAVRWSDFDLEAQSASGMTRWTAWWVKHIATCPKPRQATVALATRRRMAGGRSVLWKYVLRLDRVLANTRPCRTSVA